MQVDLNLTSFGCHVPTHHLLNSKDYRYIPYTIHLNTKNVLIFIPSMANQHYSFNCFLPSTFNDRHLNLEEPTIFDEVKSSTNNKHKPMAIALETNMSYR